MPIYKQTTEITNIDDLLSSVERDIEEVYFGDKQVFTVWDTYDGVLPATYSANGSALADYRVYGASGGVGDRTENLCHDVFRQGSTGGTASNRCCLIPSIPYTPGDNLTVKVYNSQYKFALYVINASQREIFDNGGFIGAVDTLFDTGWVEGSYTLNIDDTNAAAIILMVSYVDNRSIEPNEGKGQYVITRGSTAPAEYVPYGHEMVMSVSDGTTSTTTPIYIGSDPLGEDEYVDYGAGKIYRMINGVLTPTDPPVPLPQLPTVDGTTITEFAGQSAAVPSRFVAKYRKEGF